MGPDTDLCENCHSLFERGIVSHPSSSGRAVRFQNTPHIFRAIEGSPRDQYERWLVVRMTETPAPNVPNRFVVRPEFRSASDSFLGSLAFVVTYERQRAPLMLTALHVMDELIKSKGVNCSVHNQFYTGRELPSLISEVRLYDAFADRWVFAHLGDASAMLVLPDARLGDEAPFSDRDIAAFRAEDSAAIVPVRLATCAPAVGEDIWLVTNSYKGANKRVIGAVVVESTERTLVFCYRSRANVPSGTSGAPLINAQGEIIGINIGRGLLDNHQLGHGHHVTSIRRHLSAVD
jgi:hypothetical protein